MELNDYLFFCSIALGTLLLAIGGPEIIARMSAKSYTKRWAQGRVGTRAKFITASLFHILIGAFYFLTTIRGVVPSIMVNLLLFLIMGYPIFYLWHLKALLKELDKGNS